MSAGTVSDPRFPIGRFIWRGPLTDGQRREYIQVIADTPAALRSAVNNLADHQLDTPYRDGGWTVRQVVHHLPDSHLNAVVRMKLALTENEPMVKPYDERGWAMLPDTRGPIGPSLRLLENLHERWVTLLNALSPADFARTFRHPEYAEPRTVEWLLALYAWHGPHHVAHITGLKERKGW